MDKLKDISLGLLCTRGVSLATWHRIGMLDRELRPYKELARSCKDITLFTYGTTKDMQCWNEMPSNMTLVCRPSWIGPTLYSFLMPIIHRRIFRSITILKTNQMDGSWAGVIAKKLYGTVLVVRCGYEWLNYLEQMHRPWYKRAIAHRVECVAYRAADAIIQTSHEAGAFVRERFSIPDHRVTINPNYIDTDHFSPMRRTAMHPPKLGSVVYVGRLNPLKNAKTLIQALAGLPAELTIIGQGSHEASLRQLVHDTGISAVWKSAVTQQDLPEELCMHEIFVMPSLHEGSPKALLEAMSCGLACIATDVSGNREVVEHNKSGLLCGTEVSSMRSALHTLLADPALRQRLGAEARRTILSTYSLEQVLKRELSVYTALL